MSDLTDLVRQLALWDRITVQADTLYSQVLQDPYASLSGDLDWCGVQDELLRRYGLEMWKQHKYGRDT